MNLATVYRAFNSADAQIIRSRLEAAGMHPFVANETAALSMDGYSLAAGGILVKVPQPEVADARALIEAKDSDSEEDTRDLETGSD